MSANTPRIGPNSTPIFVSLGAQMRLEQRAGRSLRPEHPPPVEGRPPPVLATGEIGDQDVGVKVRVVPPARAVDERDRDRPLDSDVPPGPAGGPPGRQHFALEVPDRRSDGRVVRLLHPGGGVGARQRVDQAHRLRRGQGDIEREDLDALSMPVGQHLAGERVRARKERLHLGLGRRTRKTELLPNLSPTSTGPLR